jgi:hypothetical protein
MNPSIKTLVLAAAALALSVPAALAQTSVKHAAPDTASTASSGVPSEVKAYVRSHAGDAFPYSGGEIRVGHRVDDSGQEWLSIPNYPQYRFKNLAGELVVIDSSTQKVVATY